MVDSPSLLGNITPEKIAGSYIRAVMCKSFGSKCGINAWA